MLLEKKKLDISCKIRGLLFKRVRTIFLRLRIIKIIQHFMLYRRRVNRMFRS